MRCVYFERVLVGEAERITKEECVLCSLSPIIVFCIWLLSIGRSGQQFGRSTSTTTYAYVNHLNKIMLVALGRS